MPVKINLHQNAVEARVSGAFQAGLPQLCEEILNDCNQFCKEDTGTLIASSMVHSRPQDGKLIWQTPYARRQYWAIRTAFKTVNPGATWRWCEYAKQKHLAQWEKQAQRLMEMNL
ncbi:MAG: hypothetical protein J6Q14_01140 [Oscillospiraceae bacterium]|nr:hypothetical protein [Oscillospiraceae bacterium]